MLEIYTYMSCAFLQGQFGASQWVTTGTTSRDQPRVT